MKILALDVGNKRIGTAVSDELCMFAHPLYTIHRKGIKRDLEEIIRIIEEHKIERLVVGLPKNMDGSLGFQSEKTIKFVDALLSEKQIEVVYLDERLSTQEAKEIMLANNIKQENKKNIIDTIAAVVILEDYLKSIREG